MQGSPEVETCIAARYVLSQGDSPRRKVSRSTALSHATTEDDVYEGFLIPKGRLSMCTM